MRKMAWHRRHRRCPVLMFLAAASLARSSVSFAFPPFAPSRSGRTPTCGVISCRTSPSLKLTSSATAPRAAAAEAEAGGNDGADGVHINDDVDQLFGIDEFRAEKAERDRVEQEIEEREERAAAAAVAGVGQGAGLGLEGAIFPSDVFPGSPGTEDITLQDVKLENGQPEAMVGFWKLYGSTADGEDLSASVILRADGQVVGGPTVRKTPGVEWSDPEGLKPVGGRWAVYSGKRTGRARLRFNIVLSFQKKQQLEMDGTVLMVNGMAEMGGGQESEVGGALESGTDGGEPKPQVFGDVRKRSGEVLDPGEGDFSMMKVPAGEDKLIATVGSQQRRIW